MSLRPPYEKLIVWQEADRFIRLCYVLTRDFPSEEKFGVTSQLRRAAVSVALNIVEGNARGTTKDLLRFLMMSRGSLAECCYLLHLAKNLGYIDEVAYNDIEAARNRVSYLLQQNISSLKKKIG